jgi:hypothetical protein
VRTTHLITTLAATALLGFAASSAGAALSKKAYFDVRITAAQSVSWTKDVTANGCNGATVEVTGNGSSVLRTHTATKAWIIAQRVSNPSLATLQFAGRPGGTRAAGTFHREGQVQATSTQQSSSPNCGQPIAAAPDCGTVTVPRDAQLYLSYYSPAEWPYDDDPAPLVPSIVLTGPYSTEWAAPPFSFCPGVNGDDWLGGTLSSGTDPIHSGPVALPLATLFGKRRRIKLTFSQQRTIDMARIGGAIIGGKEPVTTTIDWTIRLTRRSGPPPLGSVDLS